MAAAAAAVEESPSEAVFRIRGKLGDAACICILGGTSFNAAGSEEMVKALAKAIRDRLRAKACLVTGGMAGVQRTFAEHCGCPSQLWNLLPVGQSSGYGVGTDIHAGKDLEARKTVFGLLGDVYLTVEGGPGVAGEARAAHARGACVVPIRSTGGASSGKFEFPAEALERPGYASESEWAALGDTAAPPAAVAEAAVAVVDRYIEEYSDRHFMCRAVSIAERCRTTAPNPWVGAVIVGADGKRVLGEGFHTGPGKPHAEVEAFRDAEAKGVTDFTGTTLYTTLEPCHRGPGKRTPPCDELVVAKRVKRCVVGHVDPCPKHGLLGVGFMRDAGIKVDVGVAEPEVHHSLRAYFHHRSTGMPYVVVKIATSLDGRIGCADGTSQWITKAAARQDAHRLRAESQAVLVGSGTALADKPSLTVRLPGEPINEQPLRVVLDTKGRVLEGPLMDTAMAPTLIFTSEELCSATSRTKWQECGVQVCNVPLAAAGEGAAPRLDLRAVLKELAGRGVLQLMVEGGAVLQGELLQMELCQELRVYLGATLLGTTAQPWAKTELTKTIGDAKFWRLRAVRKLDDDVCMEYDRLIGGGS